MDEGSQFDLDSVRVLIDKARDGDEAAREKLAMQLQSYISIMADRKLERNVRANVGPSDIVQQTLIQMFNGIENYRGTTTAEFYGWLNIIIRNEAARASRTLKTQKRDIRRQKSISQHDDQPNKIAPLQDYNPTPGTEAIANERIVLFYQALDKLPEDYATVIRLRNLEELSFNEIAEHMDRSPDAASKLWFRAIVKFQKELDLLDDNLRQQ